MGFSPSRLEFYTMTLIHFLSLNSSVVRFLNEKLWLHVARAARLAEQRRVAAADGRGSALKAVCQPSVDDDDIF